MLRQKDCAVSDVDLYQLSCYPRVAGADLRVRAGFNARWQPQTTGRWYSREYAREHAPLAEKPAAHQARALMPDFNFTDKQLDQLAAYLSTLQ